MRVLAGLVVAGGLVLLLGLLVSSSELPMDLGAVLWMVQEDVVSKTLATLDKAQVKLEFGGVQGACRRCASNGQDSQDETASCVQTHQWH